MLSVHRCHLPPVPRTLSPLLSPFIHSQTHKRRNLSEPNPTRFVTTISKSLPIPKGITDVLNCHGANHHHRTQSFVFIDSTLRNSLNWPPGPCQRNHCCCTRRIGGRCRGVLSLSRIGLIMNTSFQNYLLTAIDTDLPERLFPTLLADYSAMARHLSSDQFGTPAWY